MIKESSDATSGSWGRSIVALAGGYAASYFTAIIFLVFPRLFFHHTGWSHIALFAAYVLVDGFMGGYVTARLAPRAPLIHALVFGGLPALFMLLTAVGVTSLSGWSGLSEQIYTAGLGTFAWVMLELCGAAIGGYLCKRQIE